MHIDKAGYVHHGGRRMHAIVAERALGKPLPKGAVVHHVNENPLDNRNSNLVICQGHSYHRLLHYRTQAFDATGDANAIRCAHCHLWSSTSPGIETHPSGGIRRAWHPACHRAVLAASKKRRYVFDVANRLCVTCHAALNEQHVGVRCVPCARTFAQFPSQKRAAKRHHPKAQFVYDQRVTPDYSVMIQVERIER